MDGRWKKTHEKKYREERKGMKMKQRIQFLKSSSDSSETINDVRRREEETLLLYRNLGKRWWESLKCQARGETETGSLDSRFFFPPSHMFASYACDKMFWFWTYYTSKRHNSFFRPFSNDTEWKLKSEPWSEVNCMGRTESKLSNLLYVDWFITNIVNILQAVS